MSVMQKQVQYDVDYICCFSCILKSLLKALWSLKVENTFLLALSSVWHWHSDKPITYVPLEALLYYNTVIPSVLLFGVFFP